MKRSSTGTGGIGPGLCISTDMHRDRELWTAPLHKPRQRPWFDTINGECDGASVWWGSQTTLATWRERSFRGKFQKPWGRGETPCPVSLNIVSLLISHRRLHKNGRSPNQLSMFRGAQSGKTETQTSECWHHRHTIQREREEQNTFLLLGDLFPE
jgi:hypothetical protein